MGRIVSQREKTVTVSLHQTWSEMMPIDHIFAYYPESTFDYKCLGWEQVATEQSIATIDITCNSLHPTAFMEIYVVMISKRMYCRMKILVPKSPNAVSHHRTCHLGLFLTLLKSIVLRNAFIWLECIVSVVESNTVRGRS